MPALPVQSRILQRAMQQAAADNPFPTQQPQQPQQPPAILPGMAPLAPAVAVPPAMPVMVQLQDGSYAMMVPVAPGPALAAAPLL